MVCCFFTVNVCLIAKIVEVLVDIQYIIFFFSWKRKNPLLEIPVIPYGLTWFQSLDFAWRVPYVEQELLTHLEILIFSESCTVLTKWFWHQIILKINTIASQRHFSSRCPVASLHCKPLEHGMNRWPWYFISKRLRSAKEK